MRIMLVNPLSRDALPESVPLGIGYIASILMHHGHEVFVIDINAHKLSEEKVRKQISLSTFDLVGISALTPQYQYVKWLTSLIKELKPNIPIVVGNILATNSPAILLEKTQTDITVLDEGELTVLDLVDAIEKKRSLSEVNGIWFKDKGAIKTTPPRKRMSSNELDALPYPAWDLFPLDIYFKRGANPNPWYPWIFNRRTMGISTVRGCPFGCTYCCHGYGRVTTLRSAESVIKEIIEVHKRYCVTAIGFSDDLFIVNRQRTIEICNRLIDLKMPITWECAARVDLVDEDLLSLMYRAGCVSIGYGIESGSQQILDNMKKGVSVEQARKAVRLAQKNKIFAGSSFMIGMIGETEDTINESVKFVREMQLCATAFFYTTPYPNTTLYKDAQNMGRAWLDEEKYLLSLGENTTTFLINLSQFSGDRLIELKKAAEKQMRKNLKIGFKLFNLFNTVIKVYKYFSAYGFRKGISKVVKKLRCG